MKGMERFFRYIGILTPSDENSQNHPSSACEFNLAHELVKELQALGVSDAFVDENCYVRYRISAMPRRILRLLKTTTEGMSRWERAAECFAWPTSLIFLSSRAAP